jgi:hypothetical protein
MYGLLSESNAFHTAFSKKTTTIVDRNEFGFPVSKKQADIKKDKFFLGSIVPTAIAYSFLFSRRQPEQTPQLKTDSVTERQGRTNTRSLSKFLN